MRTTVVLLLLLCPLLRAQDDAPPDRFAAARAEAQKLVADGAAPSLAMAVVMDDRVVWAEAFGYADVENKLAATPDTMYWLASVSKPITATGLMILADAKSIDLDVPVNQYLGHAKVHAYVGSTDDITLRRLANHTAGFAEHWNFFYPGTEPPPRDDTITAYGFAAWAPGTRWQYSNLAFGIVDYVIERTAKQPWPEFMQAKVFAPLGMAHTGMQGRKGEAAVPYRRTAAGHFDVVPVYRFDHPGASTIWSTANDLARFMRMHLNDGELDGARVLTPASARAMRVVTGRRSAGVADGTGIAWGMRTDLDSPCFSHTGGMPGVATEVRGWPEQKAAAVVLCNCGGNAPGTVMRAIAQAVLGKSYPEAKRPERETSPAPRAPTLPTIAGKWKGRLVHAGADVPFSLSVDAETGEVQVQLKEDPPQKLDAVAGDAKHLRGRFRHQLATNPGFTGTPQLELDLDVDAEGAHMTGLCRARADGYCCLPHFVELARQK